MILAFAFLYLLIDFAALPDRSGAKRLFHRVTGRVSEHPQREWAAPETWIKREGDRLYLQVSPPQARDDVVGRVIVDRRSIGLWAPVAESFEVVAEPFDEAVRPLIESGLLLNEVTAYLVAVDPTLRTYCGGMGSGTLRFTRELQSGYLRNAVAVLCGILIASQCGFWIHHARRNRRMKRTVARGRCPMCGYDLRGALENGCSECGWGRMEGVK